MHGLRNATAQMTAGRPERFDWRHCTPDVWARAGAPIHHSLLSGDSDCCKRDPDDAQNVLN